MKSQHFEAVTPFLKELLLPNEKVVWKGQPKGGLVFSSSDIFLIPFSLVWTSVPVIGLFQMVLSARSFSSFMGIGLLIVSLFLSIGIYLLIGRFLLDIYRRKHTYYVVTNQRALIIDGIRKQRVTSIDISQTSSLELKLHSNGFATILFERLNNLGLQHSIYLFGYRIKAFEKIPNGLAVYQLLIKNRERE